jgi:DNA-binding transcriptional MerR regulator
MITTKALVRKTGLSAKTLTRWSNQGIIPKPAVQTHPSGRGKIGYWPDAVLERCLRLVQLRKEGHSVESALALLGLENFSKRLEKIEQTSFADLLAQHKVKRSDGEQVDLLEVFRATVAASLSDSVLDRDHQRSVLHQLHADNRQLLRTAVELVASGYNPILTFEGTTVRIEPDFLLGQPSASPERSSFVLPLRPVLRKFLALVGAEGVIPQARVHAAPKVWVKEGDTVVEYAVHLGGLLGFELIRETAQAVGVTRASAGDQDPKRPARQPEQSTATAEKTPVA